MQNEQDINEYKWEIIQQIQRIEEKKFLHYLYILLNEMLTSQSK